MKKPIVIFLILCLIMQFSACGADNTTNDSSITENGESSASENSAEVSDNSMSSPDESIGEVSDEVSEDFSDISSEPEAQPFEIKLSFAGDMILTSYLNQPGDGLFDEYAEANEPEYFLEKVRHIFEEDDFTLVNLESCVSDNELTPVHKNSNRPFWFVAPTKNLEILTCSSIEGVSLANNHSGDFGEEGYNDTVESVKNAKLEYGDDEEIIYFEKNGFVVAFICCGLWNESYAEIISGYVDMAEEKSDYQVVFFHGGKENVHTPEEWKKRACRQIVDSGADLIIGGHPHVLQPCETYNDAEIVYSIGNFCFGGNRRPENRTAIYQMTLTVDENGELVSREPNIIPCYVYTGSRNNYQPQIITDEDEIQQVLDYMAWKTDKPL